MPEPISPELADRIVREAESWLRTPFHHRQAVKGAGIDCVHFLLRVYQAVGLVPLELEAGEYAAEWYLHRDEPLFLLGVERYASKVENGQRGDVAMYNFGRHAAHGAIIVSEELMIHAYRPSGNVEYCERRSLAERLDSYWRVRT